MALTRLGPNPLIIVIGLQQGILALPSSMPRPCLVQAIDRLDPRGVGWSALAVRVEAQDDGRAPVIPGLGKTGASQETIDLLSLRSL
ncbi:MAG TPA: hypothetical protein PLY97_08240 [Acidocella sp.]|nr:hypothetical protein [Acidocella sp.]